MHQFGSLSERGGNFLNLHQKDRGTQKGGEVISSEKGRGGGGGGGGGVPTMEESMHIAA